MAYVDGKIDFSRLKGFPVLNDNSKFQTQGFLDGAKELVSIIEEVSILFTPIVYDMNGNIEKIKVIFFSSVIKSLFLEDVLCYEIQNSTEGQIIPIVDALLWLKRGLELIENFFRRVANDATLKDSLEEHLREAYTETLKPYNGLIVQKAFSAFCKIIPKRSTIIGSDPENVRHLFSHLERLRSHLNWINAFYTQHNLHYQYQVNSINQPNRNF